MASNEHKNLSEANLHNPKGLSLATNDTVCSKDDAGALAWLDKSSLKVAKKSFAGYCTPIVTYQYPGSFHNNNRSPYDLSVDYGSATISAATTVLQKKFFKIGTHNIMDEAGEVQKCLVQITSPDAQDFTVALVKYTPSSSVTTAYPVVLFEKAVVGGSSSDKVISYALTVPGDFTNTDVAAGDHLFLMVKSDEAEPAAVEVIVSVAIELGYTN